MSEAEQILKMYLNEMTSFELKWIPMLTNSWEELATEENIELRRNDVENIFNKYLSIRCLSAKQSRLEALQFGNPPQHDDEILKVEEITKNKVQIFTKNKHTEAECRYDLIYENNNWKLDAKAYDGMKWKTMRNQF